MRLGRDIPPHHVVEGPRWGSMRQVVLRHMERLGLRCVEIRCREVGVRLANGVLVEPGPVEIGRLEYEASRGVKLFFEAVGPDDTLYGILRLRMPHAPYKPELVGKAALVRELHVYGPEVPAGERGRGGNTSASGGRSWRGLRRRLGSFHV